MRHPYHLVEPSPWPVLLSLNLLFSLISLVSYFNGYMYSFINVRLGFLTVLIITILWFYDIISESLFMGFHSFKVSKGLILGFLLFLITETMLFFSFFWAYFHSALNPTNLIFPPIGIDLVNPWGIPLLNTILLLYSGVAATWAHHSFINLKRKESLISLSTGILLGLIFTSLQIMEYLNSSFDISDSVYSSAFYLLTGLHGFHVIVGVSFLSVVLYRVYHFHNSSLIYDLSLIYWHFVDIVWIILFVLIYYLTY